MIKLLSALVKLSMLNRVWNLITITRKLLLKLALIEVSCYCSTIQIEIMLKGFLAYLIVSNDETSISTSKASTAKSCIEFRDPQMQSVAKTREFLHPTVFSCLC